jgi:hypothetical protein
LRVPGTPADFDSTLNAVPAATLFAFQISLPAGGAQVSAFGVTNTGTDPVNLRLGLYDDSADLPGTLLENSTLLPLTAAGTTEVPALTGGGACRPAGTYWIAGWADGAISLGKKNGTVTSLSVTTAYANPGNDLPATWPASMPAAQALPLSMWVVTQH